MQTCVACDIGRVLAEVYGMGKPIDPVELEKELIPASHYPHIAKPTGYLFCPKCGLVYKEVE